MSKLQEIKALISESGLSKRQLLRELIDDVMLPPESGAESCSSCEFRCISCLNGCSSGPAR